jgi:hypothetical protein
MVLLSSLSNLTLPSECFFTIFTCEFTLRNSKVHPEDKISKLNCDNSSTQVSMFSKQQNATGPEYWKSECKKRQIFFTFLLTSLSLYIFTMWKSIVYYCLCYK